MATPTGYRPRLADTHLVDLLAEFPAVMINGARATGTTTTARQHVADVFSPDVRGVAASMRADPDAALRRASHPVLLDEWQEVPEALGAVKRAVDRDSRPGQYLLTGSVRAEPTHEMWAGTGRIVRLAMHGLSERELPGAAASQRLPFVARLAGAGEASSRGEDIGEFFPRRPCSLTSTGTSRWPFAVGFPSWPTATARARVGRPGCPATWTIY